VPRPLPQPVPRPQPLLRLPLPHLPLRVPQRVHLQVPRHQQLQLYNMICKQTTSISGVWKPSTSETSKKLAGPCEITALKLAAGGGASVVAIYNGSSSADVIPANLAWVLDASTTDIDSQVFPNPISFSKGVFAVVEQGADFNPMVCISKVNL